MGFIKGIFNAVADPRLFFILAVASIGASVYLVARWASS